MKRGNALKRLRRKIRQILNDRASGYLGEPYAALRLDLLKTGHPKNYFRALELEHKRSRTMK